MAATQTTHTFLRDLWALARPYWFSEERRSARGLLAAVVALNLGIVYLNVLFKERICRLTQAVTHCFHVSRLSSKEDVVTKQGRSV